MNELRPARKGIPQDGIEHLQAPAFEVERPISRFLIAAKPGTIPLMSGLGDLAAYERQTGPYNGVVIGPWIEELVRQYRRPAPRRSRAWLLVAVLCAIGGLLSPWLMRLDAAAYPSEPEKRRALDLCSREDPTFVRFFASARTGCYRRIVGRDAPADGLGDASR